MVQEDNRLSDVKTVNDDIYSQTYHVQPGTSGRNALKEIITKLYLIYADRNLLCP